MNHGQVKMTQDYLECMNKKSIERLYPITVNIPILRLLLKYRDSVK